MARLLFFLVPAAVVFWVVSVVDCVLQPPSRHRGVSKGAWIAITLLLPVVGGILWFALGRIRKTPPPLQRAPDDDPAFLRSLSPRRSAPSHPSDLDDEERRRIRELEEQLSRLDPENPDDERPR